MSLSITAKKSLALGILTISFSLAGCRLDKDPIKPVDPPCSEGRAAKSVGSTSASEFNASGVSDKTLNIFLKGKMTTPEINKLAEKYNAKVVNYIKSIDLLILELKDSSDSKSINRFKGELPVKDAFQALKMSLDPLPVISKAAEKPKDEAPATKINDPLFKDQYGLKLINIEKAWEISPGKPEIKIAVIDTGIDMYHPDLKDKIVPGKNFVEANKQPNDDDGHGTHTAGIIAAAVNNKIGVASVCDKCVIMPVKVLGGDGTGSDSQVAAGIVWAADNGAKVMNMSMAMARSSRTIERALQYALDKNITLVAAAGNKNMDYPVHLPSKYPGVIEVTATDAEDERASFSNYGNSVSVSAPGVRILSTFPTNPDPKCSNYSVESGTSMAAPHVSGLAALILSEKPGLKPAEVKKIMESTAKDLGSEGWDKYYGHGRIDALAALKSLSK